MTPYFARTDGMITPAASALIEKTLTDCLDTYEIDDYPLDAFELIEKIIRKGLIRLDVRYTAPGTLSCDGVSVYLPEIDSSLIILNRPPENWRLSSSGRRCNFTAAHEIGHILLGHLRVPSHLKTETEKRREEREADEFAGRLLMPEVLLLRACPQRETPLSGAFLVSDSAVYTRLSRLHRLDRYTAPPRTVCAVCGNDRISPAAYFCEICGSNLIKNGLCGALVSEYNDYTELESGNHCVNAFCRYRCAPRARVCPICGHGTEYAARGLHISWQTERRAYIRRVTRGKTETP